MNAMYFVRNIQQITQEHISRLRRACEMKRVLVGMIMAFVLVPSWDAVAQEAPASAYVLPMPAHSEFSGFEGGQVFVRVTPLADGGIVAAMLLGIELMAADTVAYHYTDARLFDEEVSPDPLTGTDATYVPELRKVVAAGMSSIRLNPADLRRFERMQGPLVVTVALRRQ